MKIKVNKKLSNKLTCVGGRGPLFIGLLMPSGSCLLCILTCIPHIKAGRITFSPFSDVFPYLQSEKIHKTCGSAFKNKKLGNIK